MKKLNYILLNVGFFAMMPVMAGAVGTYYNGELYQKPQYRYAQNNGDFYNSYGAGRGFYNQNMQQGMGAQKNVARVQKKTPESVVKQGFHLDAGISHEFADWDFEMMNAGSKLRYDGLRWNVFDANAAYYFGDSVPMQIRVGGRYGMQFDEISMIDDDITAEKMWEIQEIPDGNGGTEYGVVGNPAVSLGTSKGGTQMGFNAAFGLTDFFKWGNVKVTPSVGYRYFKYELETKRNYGMAMQVLNSESYVNCVEVQDGEIQCSPFVGFTNVAGGEPVTYAGFAVTQDGTYVIENLVYSYLDLGNSYYYEQSGVSHKYETTWAGPYLALDMEYMVNNDNFINGGVEFGLPIYNSKGDQPYRIDWAHPTSVEDKGDFGDAWHLALNTNWSTRVAESVFLSLGFTYDFYKVSDATANTNLNPAYYQNILNLYQDAYNQDLLTAEGEAYLAELYNLQAAGWKIKNDKEIESIYRSMGIRLGVNVKF